MTWITQPCQTRREFFGSILDREIINDISRYQKALSHDASFFIFPFEKMAIVEIIKIRHVIVTIGDLYEGSEERFTRRPWRTIQGRPRTTVTSGVNVHDILVKKRSDFSTFSDKVSEFGRESAKFFSQPRETHWTDYGTT